MSKRNTAQETAASGITGSVSKNFVGLHSLITATCDPASCSWYIPGLGSAGNSLRKPGSQTAGERTVEECQCFIIELTRELNRILKNSAVPRDFSEKDACSPEDSRRFIEKWASELDQLFQISKRRGTPAVKDRLKECQRIISEWVSPLKRMPEESVSFGIHMDQGVAELVKEWKQGKLRNILPILEFILWALIRERSISHTEKRTQHITAAIFIPDSVWRWIRDAAVDLTLEPSSSNSNFLLSEDRKRVRRGTRQAPAVDPTRLDRWPCVLSREGFTSGRHYWEVEVGGNTYWKVGVTRESALGRGGEFDMTLQGGYSTLWWDGYQFWAVTDPRSPLPLSLKPGKLGVYLDYEGGQLSFYNVETRSHIYTFTDLEFNGSGKVYPVFYTRDWKKELVLAPPGGSED
ncbi:butyrophilin subfamily 1 member A1-like [Acipenser ruthenus]|uniref:butyrophilin subfamily 1 member A1-like n=1 Tax=Acipenser ruthenus TaxID=7906 RepID=UPI00155FAF32|nr:butyrophilin subfamily 1 member A1-like [Acipenser ruthenus]